MTGNSLNVMTAPNDRCFPQRATAGDGIQPANIVAELEIPFRRYLAIDSGSPLVLALWTLATYLFDCFDAFPYLAVTSPTKRCGKTRLAELLEFACARPRPTVGISPAALFRIVEKEKPTLIIDEAEALRARDDRANALREILNAGHRKGKKVPRCVGGNGKDYKVKEFETFGPKVLVLIGALPETIGDRCIPVGMKRRTTEQLGRFRFSKVKAETTHLTGAAKQWAEANRAEVERWYASNDVECLEDREADLWLPLFSVCAVAAPERITELQRIASQISGAKAAGEPSDWGIKLLADIREAFTSIDCNRVPTADLLDKLKDMEESPWLTWSQGRGLDARSLSHTLRPFGIRPQNLRIGESVIKGYLREDFEDSWARYLLPTSSRYAATRPINTGENGDSASATPAATVPATESAPNECSASVADCSASQNKGIANAGAGCSDVAANGGSFEPPLAL